VAFARWPADNELTNASAAALIIEPDCEPLLEGDWGKFIASAGDSNKETPAMPSVDCKNSRRPALLLSFDGLVISASLSMNKGVSVALVLFLTGVFVNL
jgi:hypothetical protein